jgi:protein-tyrosine phosphatase
MKQILFLCSGNYYRSRFAEIFFNWHAQQRGLRWYAESRGLALEPRNAGPISRHAVASLAARGISCDEYIRAPLLVTDADFTAAHRIIAVKEAEHRPIVESRHSAWRGLVEYWRIDDIDCATPEEAIPLLEREVLRLLERLSAMAA